MLSTRKHAQEERPEPSLLEMVSRWKQLSEEAGAVSEWVKGRLFMPGPAHFRAQQGKNEPCGRRSLSFNLS